MNQPSLPGNPHYQNVVEQMEAVADLTTQEQMQVDATLALAFEQRTANLINRELLAMEPDTSPQAQHDIDARLGKQQPAPPTPSPARTVADEAQELHRIIGGILETARGLGQYDTLVSYEDQLERALELAAIYVADTEN